MITEKTILVDRGNKDKMIHQIKTLSFPGKDASKKELQKRLEFIHMLALYRLDIK